MKGDSYSDAVAVPSSRENDHQARKSKRHLSSYILKIFPFYDMTSVFVSNRSVNGFRIFGPALNAVYSGRFV